MPAPIVIVPSDVIVHNHLRWSGTPAAYLDAIDGVGLLPVQLPTIETALDALPLLDAASGVVATGARSNVHPARYGSEPRVEAEPFDHDRDRASLGLIEAARRRDLPLLCICRGIQEMNVAFGGTLGVEIHDQPGRFDHRSTPDADLKAWFALKHDVELTPGGLLARLTGARRLRVNSVHRQAVDRLGADLVVEATAGDGTIEAVSAPEMTFGLGVQWHPEHLVPEDAPSVAIFRAFADAVRAHAAGRPRAAA